MMILRSEAQMSRKVQRVPYTLDEKGIEKGPLADITAILRAADPLIISDGRAMLAKILKG